MKKIVLLLCAFMLINFRAFAHPPSDIKIEFDKENQTLKAVIYHPVSNRMTHYIKKVDIGLNGNEIRTLDFGEQQENVSQPIEIVIENVKPGDILSVEGYCSLSGKLEKEIKIS